MVLLAAFPFSSTAAKKYRVSNNHGAYVCFQPQRPHPLGRRSVPLLVDRPQDHDLSTP
jgi:hypothetical protein